jgi:MFS family permease
MKPQNSTATSVTEARDRRYILVVACLTSFASTLATSAVVVALPAIGTELSLNAVQLGWIAQGLVLASAVFVLPFGRLADIWGIRKIFAIGLVVSTASMFLAGWSTSFLMLLLLRVVQGIGFAMVYSTGVALLTSSYPLAERGKVLGINMAAIYVGLSLGPSIGGILTENVGWRSIFFLSFALLLVGLAILFSRVRREWREAKGEKYDLLGSVLFCIMLFALMYGFSLLPTATGIWIVSIGVIGLVGFVAWEFRTETPIFNMHLITRNRLFAFSSLTQFMYHVSMFSVSFVVSLYLQYIHGFSPQTAGFVMLAQPVVQAALATVGGRLSDRVQPRIIASVGLIIVLAGLLLLLFYTTSNTLLLLVVIISLALLGAGAAFFAPPNANAIMSSVEMKQFGVASAIESVTRSTGQSFSMGILLLLFSVRMGTAQITPEYYPAFTESIKIALVVFAALCFCSIFVSAARGKLAQRPR